MPKQKRTPADINRQIEGLRTMRQNIPERSFFGDDNWKAIDAQISVLEGKEGADDYENSDPETYSAAENAEMWLNCLDDSDLFDED